MSDDQVPDLDPAESEMFMRMWHLRSACRAGERIDVEGVFFDLAHPDLDRTQWSPTSVLGAVRFDRNAPRLLFPWSSEDDRLIQNARGNAQEVKAGDTVVILGVKVIPVRAAQGQLDHPHHQESRWAELGLKSAAGRITPIAQAWEFRGAADVMTPLSRGDYFHAQQALYARLQTALGFEEDVESLMLSDDRSDWPTFSSLADPLYHQAIVALWSAESSADEEGRAVFGYLMARAEANERLLPLAARHADVKANNRRNAQKPRRGGEETREAALEIIAQSPDISRRRCAERVAEIRGLSDLKSIYQRIDQYFEKGTNGRFRPTAAAILKALSKRGG
ncbi:hypothetical protein [Brevundimonas sp.]|uniref:hypothetical protein n=1 Tax=Brevundimonas sp. TaxID=1871086 RepID=UPI002FCBF176